MMKLLHDSTEIKNEQFLELLSILQWLYLYDKKKYTKIVKEASVYFIPYVESILFENEEWYASFCDFMYMNKKGEKYGRIKSKTRSL